MFGPVRPPKKWSFIAQCQQVLAYIKSRSYSQLLWWMSGGRTVQQSLAPQSTSQRGATSGQNSSTHPQMFRSTVGQWFCCIKSLPQKGRRQQHLLFFSLVLEQGGLSPLRQKSRRWCLRRPSPSSPRHPEACGRDSASMPSWDKPLRGGRTRRLGERERKGRSRRRRRRRGGCRWSDTEVSSGSAHP